jgi:hypothetical protein
VFRQGHFSRRKQEYPVKEEGRPISIGRQRIRWRYMVKINLKIHKTRRPGCSGKEDPVKVDEQLPERK